MLGNKEPPDRGKDPDDWADVDMEEASVNRKSKQDIDNNHLPGDNVSSQTKVCPRRNALATGVCKDTAITSSSSRSISQPNLSENYDESDSNNVTDNQRKSDMTKNQDSEENYYRELIKNVYRSSDPGPYFVFVEHKEKS